MAFLDEGPMMRSLMTVQVNSGQRDDPAQSIEPVAVSARSELRLRSNENRDEANAATRTMGKAIALPDHVESRCCAGTKTVAAVQKIRHETLVDRRPHRE